VVRAILRGALKHAGAEVEFVSAAGNPQALLTGKALFSWQKDRRASGWRACTRVYGGRGANDTGFDLIFKAKPSPRNGTGAFAVARAGGEGDRADYPDFTKRVWGIN
jgi:hypothetical protein